jgi:hypothetical protein
MKWLLITWLMGADCLPQLPISIAAYDTQAKCESVRKTLSVGTGSVCRETKQVATLQVVK